MNDKIPITRPLHPKFIIQYAVNSVARRLYSVKWEPRVVRQEARKIEGSTLSSIDYAIPCFDLAQQLGRDVISVAGEIAVELKKKLNDASDTEYFQFIHSENIHGYLNFEVADVFLTDVIKNSAEWYGNPSNIIPSPLVNIDVIGYDIMDTDQNENLMHSLGLILSTASAVGQKFEVEIELPDASTGTLDELAKRIVQSENTQVEASAIMQKKKLLRNRLSQLDTPHPLDQEYEEILGHIMRPFLQLVSDLQIKSNSQIELIKPVNTTFEKVVSELSALTDLLIIDEANLAIYLSFEETVVPVRSAEGFLYPAAYMIHQIVGNASQEVGMTYVFIAPHKHHGLLRLLTERLQPSNRYILYDPFVSRADISEIIAAVGTFSSLLESVHSTLKKVEKIEHIPLSRSELFFVADFAMDISLSLREIQFPIFFDNLNQLVSIVKMVTSDEDHG